MVKCYIQMDVLTLPPSPPCLQMNVFLVLSALGLNPKDQQGKTDTYPPIPRVNCTAELNGVLYYGSTT